MTDKFDELFEEYSPVQVPFTSIIVRWVIYILVATNIISWIGVL